MIPAVPTTTAIVKIHRNSRSRTMATYFQSSLALVASSLALVCSAMKLTQTQDLCMAGEHLVWSNGGVAPRLATLGLPPPPAPPPRSATQTGSPQPPVPPEKYHTWGPYWQGRLQGGSGLLRLGLGRNLQGRPVKFALTNQRFAAGRERRRRRPPLVSHVGPGIRWMQLQQRLLQYLSLKVAVKSYLSGESILSGLSLSALCGHNWTGMRKYGAVSQ